jgi:sulfur-oxidizing protein SoxY
MRERRRTRDADGGARLTRRAILTRLGALGVAAASGGFGLPQLVSAQTLGAQESVESGLKRFFGTRPLKDGSGLVKLDIPLIAENGAVVPVSVEVTSPMTPSDHVKHIYIIADKNRIPIVSRVTLTPGAGQAYVAENIRLGETGDVRAIVEQSDGTLLQVKRAVRVTVSGCAA